MHEYGVVPVLFALYVSTMGLNLIKTAAGLQEIDQLILRQASGKQKYKGVTATYAYTRYKPTRGDEILSSGGSIYWILKSKIQVRQKILGFEMATEDDGTTWCMMMVDPQLTQTIAVPKRAIQGWRYLEQKDAPKDRGIYVFGSSSDEPPEDMAVDLKNMGLL
jgi:hypothetical protein